jgi:hypothetical protein
MSRPLMTGCPQGCQAGSHECGVGDAIPGPIDYLDSGIFVIHDGAPVLSSLREQAAQLGLSW